MPVKKDDPGTGGPNPPDNTTRTRGAGFTPRYDRVTHVLRHADGTPAHRPGFVLLLPEDATDEERASAWNNGGDLPPADANIEFYPRLD